MVKVLSLSQPCMRVFVLKFVCISKFTHLNVTLRLVNLDLDKNGENIAEAYVAGSTGIEHAKGGGVSVRCVHAPNHYRSLNLHDHLVSFSLDFLPCILPKEHLKSAALRSHLFSFAL